MNYSRIAMAALAATVAYFAYGMLLWFLVPAMKEEGRKFAGVFRPHEDLNRMMPLGLAATFGAVLAVTLLFARSHPQGAGAAEGASFGALIGAFVLFGFVLHNYVNLSLGLKLTVMQGVAFFIDWMIVGVIIALIYRQ